MNAAPVCILAGAVSEQSLGYEASNEAWAQVWGYFERGSLGLLIIVTGGGSIVN